MAAEVDHEEGGEVVEFVVETSELGYDLQKPLKEEEKVRLIQAVERHSCLWDTSKQVYKNRVAKTTALQVLSEEFGLTTNNVKRLLHSVRSALVREVKKELDGQTSKWKFYDTVAYMKADVLRGMKVKEEREWTDMETEKLIDFYRENEQLWNHNLTSYRDRALKDLNYKKICEILPNRNQDNIKKQWQTLKTIFYREHKREEGSKVSGTGTDTVYSSQWKFFKHMFFIKGSDDVDPAVSTLENTTSVVVRPTKKIKLERAKDMEVVKLEFFKEAINCLRAPLHETAVNATVNTADDEISLFVKSIESTLRRMSGRQLVLARKRINDVIFEVEMEAYQTTPFTTPPSTSRQRTDQLPDVYSASLASTFNWPVQ